MVITVKDKTSPDYRKYMRRPGSPEPEVDLDFSAAGTTADDIPWAEILPQENETAVRPKTQLQYSQVAWEDLSAAPLAELEPFLADSRTLDPPPLPFLLAAAWMLFALLAL
ncbi:MAG: hypothetical protein AB1473_17970 [Thermodesulfobacteriota bacterium]